MTKLDIIKQDTEHIYETYKKKNSNYGDSFTKTIDELGETAGLVPLYNKIHRATSLLKNGNNNFESLEDTLLDLATYALMLDADIKTRNTESFKQKPEDNMMLLNERKTLSSDDNSKPINLEINADTDIQQTILSWKNNVESNYFPLNEKISNYEEK